MALHWPTFIQRTTSAVVFAIIMMAGLLWNQWSFLALVLLIEILCLHEYLKLANKIASIEFSFIQKVIIHIGGLSLTLTMMMLSFGFWNNTLDILFGLMSVLPILLLLQGALHPKNQLIQGVWGISGWLYLSLPMMMLLYLYQENHLYPLALILMIWTNDTMAYLMGSFFGKTPFNEISPKKTWEGTILGALMTVIGALVWAYFSHQISLIDASVFAICAAVAGTAGDLLESRLKRMAGVKDSGAIMPGHGGALDRFDSLLVATPFVFFYLLLS